jgi:hypothetical protein
MEDQCPSNDYKQGEPQGKCWGDGHYRCQSCIFYRADFKKYGQELIDYMHQIQGQIQITSI